MDSLAGKRVRAEDGTEGIVVAVKHGGGGMAGWQLLLVTEDNRVVPAGALNAHLVPTEPLVG